VGKEMLDNCGTCHTSLKYREPGSPQMASLSKR
jgi:mono/diheme cytochrome c family protein